MIHVKWTQPGIIYVLVNTFHPLQPTS